MRQDEIVDIDGPLLPGQSAMATEGVHKRKKSIFENNVQTQNNESAADWDEELGHSKTAGQSYNGALLLCVLSAVLGSFQFGYNMGVPNNPENVIRKCLNPGTVSIFGLILPGCIAMDEVQWGFVVATFSLGGLLGGLSGGMLCKRFGRKATLLYNNVFFLVGAALLSLASDISQMALARFIIGVGCGIATAAVPMYIAEVAPTRLRGTLGALHQLAIVVGILVAQVASMFMSTRELWRYLFGLTAVPALLQVALMSFTVESPRFLISLRERDAAMRVLQFIRNTNDVSDELNLLVHVRDKDSADGQQQNVTFFSFFRESVLKKALLIAVISQMAQQLCGINGVIQYSTSIFEKILGSNAEYVTLSIGIVNLFMTIISAMLMDYAGRRVLLLSSASGVVCMSCLIVISSLLNWDFVSAVCIVAFVAFFAIGLGPIPWLVIGEIFPTKAVATASAISVTLNWTSAIIVTVIFPTVASTLGSYTFFPFAVVEAVLAFILFVIMPETKGKTIEEVIERLK